MVRLERTGDTPLKNKGKNRQVDKKNGGQPPATRYLPPIPSRKLALAILVALTLLTMACGSFAPRPEEQPLLRPTRKPQIPPTSTLASTPSPQPPSLSTTAATDAADPPTIPAPLEPQPTLSPTSTPAGNITLGQLARVVAVAGVNIRQNPSTSAPRAGFYASGALVDVLEGPVYADDYVWWRVDDRHGKSGWIAAGDGKTLWLNGEIGEPRPVNRPVRLGDTVYVSVAPGKLLTIRFEPGKRGLVARRVKAGTLLSTLEGPVIVGGLRWWKVRRIEDGLTGWAAEGDRKTRWLKPME